MALGLTFSNGKPASMARGKYQTRNNRLVEITGHRTVSGSTGTVSWTKVVWDGVLYQGDQKTVESHATWSNEGGYLHQEGVGNQLDLMTVITQEVEPEPAAFHNDPAILEHQIVLAALCKDLIRQQVDQENVVETLKRIIDERDRAESEPTEVAEKAHAFDELLLILSEQAGTEHAGEHPSITLQRIIGQRDTAQRQVAALLKTPVV
jgi:hypothetical protein